MSPASFSRLSTPPGVGVVTESELDSRAVAEGSAFADVAKHSGVDNTGTTECAAALNTAISAIVALGHRPYAKGTFKVASTVTIAGSCDFGDATFNYTATSGTAVLVGTATSGVNVSHIAAILPRVVCTSKVEGAGWAALAGSIGVDLSNVSASRVVIPWVRGFETNVRMYGKGKGCTYNQVTLGHLDNGKLNLLLSADASGWTNENLFLGGEFSHESTEGTNVSGTRHIVIAVTTNAINNNVWVKPSVEGNVAEYHIEIAGSYNRIIHGRYEATTPKVRWQTDASRNVIDNGYKAASVVQTWETGSVSNRVLSADTTWWPAAAGTTGLTVIENASSSSYPIETIMEAGAHNTGVSPATGYAVKRSAEASSYKRASDAYPRAKIDHVNGRIYLGTGAADPDAYWRGGVGYLAPNGSILFLTTNTYDLGSTDYRPRDLWLGRNATIGGAIDHDGSAVGFYGTTPASKPTVTGSRGSNAALASLLTALAGLGLITDSSSA